MAYNGAGVFSLYSPGNPVVTGTTISSTWANNTLSDIATGLSTCILKNGTQTTTAAIPFATQINSTATTDSTTSTTGAIVTAGGLGVAKALFVGTTMNVAGIATLFEFYSQKATGTAPDATPINIFSTLTSGGLYLVAIGSSDNNVRCLYWVYYNGATIGQAALDTSNYTITSSGAQLKIVNGSGVSQSYNATLLRIG